VLLLCRVNDIIVSVNGISTVNVTHGQAVDALKRAGNVVSLVAYTPVSIEINTSPDFGPQSNSRILYKTVGARHTPDFLFTLLNV